MIECRICGKVKDRRHFRMIDKFRISFVCNDCNRPIQEAKRKEWEKSIRASVEKALKGESE